MISFQKTFSHIFSVIEVQPNYIKQILFKHLNTVTVKATGLWAVYNTHKIQTGKIKCYEIKSIIIQTTNLRDFDPHANRVKGLALLAVLSSSVLVRLVHTVAPRWAIEFLILKLSKQGTTNFLKLYLFLGRAATKLYLYKGLVVNCI